MNEKQLLLLAFDILNIPYEEHPFLPLLFIDYKGIDYTISFWNRETIIGQLSKESENRDMLTVLWNRHDYEDEFIL